MNQEIMASRAFFKKYCLLIGLASIITVGLQLVLVVESSVGKRSFEHFKSKVFSSLAVLQKRFFAEHRGTKTLAGQIESEKQFWKLSGEEFNLESISPGLNAELDVLLEYRSEDKVRRAQVRRLLYRRIIQSELSRYSEEQLSSENSLGKLRKNIKAALVVNLADSGLVDFHLADLKLFRYK